MNGDDQQFEITPVTAPDGSVIPVRHPTGADQRRIKGFAAQEYYKTHPRPEAPPPVAISAAPDVADITDVAANVDPGEFTSAIPRGVVRGLASLPAALSQVASPFDVRTGQPQGPLATTAEQIAEPIAQGVTKVTGGYIPMEKPTTKSGEAGERLGEFLGDPASWVGPGGPIVKGLSAVGAGLGSFFGEQVGGTPGAVIGSALGGGAGGGLSPRGLPKRPPAAVRAATTEEEVKGASQTAYKEMEALQFTLPTAQAGVLKQAVYNQLVAEGYRPYAGSAPGAFKALEEIKTPYAKPTTLRTTGGVTVGDLEAARQAFNKIRVNGGTEAMAAGAAIEAIDDYLLNLPGVAGISERARKNWAAYKRGQIVEETIQRALDRAASAHTGANIDNAIKQEFLRRIKNKEKVWRSFSPLEQAEIDKIINPGRALNFARYLSRFSPRHLLTAVVSGGAAHVAGASLPQLAALATAGEVAHQIGKRATHGRSERLLEITRARSPAGGNYQPPPPLSRAGRAGAGAARALGATALSPEVTEAIELPEITVTPQ